MNDLEKMDALKQRMNISYAQAKEALDQCGGDVASALVYLEEKGYAPAEGFGLEQEEEVEEEKWDKEKTDHFVRGILDEVKTFIQEGNVTKVRLIHEDKVLIELPATIGILGAGALLVSPLLAVLTAVGAAAAVLKEMVIEVVKADGTVERHELKFPSFGQKAEGEECDCEDCDCEDADCCSEESEADAEAEVEAQAEADTESEAKSDDNSSGDDIVNIG